MKKLIISLLCGIIIAISVTAFAADSIRLIINGIDVTDNMEVKPQLINGEVVVPASVIGEALGAVVEYDEETNSITVTKPKAIVPVGDIGTRLNPVPVGTTVVFDSMERSSDAYKIEMTALEVLRGDEATDFVMSISDMNKKPAEDKEYIFIRFRINGLESKNDEMIDIRSSHFRFYNEKYVSYGGPLTDVYGLGVNFPDFYQGTEIEGFAYYLIDKGDNPSIYYREYFDSSSIWFGTKIE